MSLQIAKELAQLADRLARMDHRKVTRSELDRIIVALRLGEKTIVQLVEDARREK